MSKKKTTMAEKRYMGRVAALGCCLCEHFGYYDTPAELHHPRHDIGMAQRASNYDVIPLCSTHHRGKNGVHDLGHDEFTAFYGISELELMAIVKRKVSPVST